MDFIKDFFSTLTNPSELIKTGSYIVLVLIVFAETGLLIGFFLPGDSLLVTAGVFAAAGTFDIFVLNALLIPAAIIGDAVGYSIGKKSGQRLLNRPDGKFFKRSHIEKTQAFYDKHGGKTIIIARFVPLVRTFAPVVAGIAGMPYRKFAIYNVVGAFVWVMSTTFCGYFLANQFGQENLEKHLHIVIGVVIVLSLLPPVIEFIRHRVAAKKEA